VQADPTWHVLASPATTALHRQPVSLRRLLTQVAVLVAIVVTVVGIAAVVVNQRIAKQEAVHEVAGITDILAESVVQPALTDAMVNDPAAASTGLQAGMRSGLATTHAVRVKLWTASGVVLYSDEKRLIGKSFALDDEAREALTTPRTEASISDLSRPENAFESKAGSKLLEVYRPVWTPSGKPLLLEAYFPYSLVTDRSRDLWRGFSGIMLSSLAAVLLLLAPLLWSFYRRARRAQSQREAMMSRAVDASNEERRRIAATLHDGVVQQLAGAAFTIAGESRLAASQGDPELAHRLVDAETAVRDSVSGMRSLLVDIYPPSLSAGGLDAALADLAKTLTGSDIQVSLEVDSQATDALNPDQQRAVFRVAQECLRNAEKHAAARHVALRLLQLPQAVHLEVSDDGVGFAPEDVHRGKEGHFGLQLMADASVAVGATLSVCSRPGRGTRFRMELPTR
jgi:signal transduction histidine kinase